MRKTILVSLLVTLSIPLANTAFGQQRQPGILGQQAPAWNIDQWHNLPDGISSLDVDDFRGQVLYLFCFQSWCPGCHSHGFPTLQEVQQNYADNADVAFVAVQTVFEGFHTNTVDKAWDTVADYDLDLPVAHDQGEGDRPSPLMAKYRTGGTPWTIIIDRQGVVRFNGFGIKSEQAIGLIDQLLRPAAEGGREL